MQEEFYAKICNLSYMGDLRMLFAEDRHKVSWLKLMETWGTECCLLVAPVKSMFSPKALVFLFLSFPYPVLLGKDDSF